MKDLYKFLLKDRRELMKDFYKFVLKHSGISFSVRNHPEF